MLPFEHTDGHEYHLIMAKRSGATVKAKKCQCCLGPSLLVNNGAVTPCHFTSLSVCFLSNFC